MVHDAAIPPRVSRVMAGERELLAEISAIAVVVEGAGEALADGAQEVDQVGRGQRRRDRLAKNPQRRYH